jgi:hypothetical protein
METRGHMLDWIRQTVCGMHGHDTLLQFEQERMFLKCVSCGHETPGWELNEAPPVTLDTAEPVSERRREVAMHPHLVSERRVA